MLHFSSKHLPTTYSYKSINLTSMDDVQVQGHRQVFSPYSYPVNL